MDRDSFLEVVRRQYKEEIQEAYLECEHDDGRTIDYKRLDQEMKRLMSAAKAEGVTQAEFISLVKATLPEAFPKLAMATGAQVKAAA